MADAELLARYHEAKAAVQRPPDDDGVHDDHLHSDAEEAEEERKTSGSWLGSFEGQAVHAAQVQGHQRQSTGHGGAGGKSSHKGQSGGHGLGHGHGLGLGLGPVPATADDVVVMKRSIQEFMRGRLLSLEKVNRQLSEQRSVARTQGKKWRGVDKLCGALKTWRLRKLSWALFAFERHTLLERVREQILQEDQQSREDAEDRQLDERNLRDARTISRLRADNRRLQVELDDRSRAAELLCKRLLRVDASQRQPSR